MLAYSTTFSGIGTEWRLDTSTPPISSTLSKIKSRIEKFDRTYSRFRSDSLVRKLASTPGIYAFPPDAAHIIDFYRCLYDVTDGRFTPLIGSMLEHAGYDPTYSFRQRPQVPLPSWNEAMQWQGREVTTRQPIVLDIGAAGKGYLVDIVSTILDESGIDEYVIDASGDLRHKGTSENRVGFEHPLDSERAIGMIDVKNASLCASASNRRRWGQGMHHIFDPHAKQPVKNVIATWVIAKECMIADGVATALFFTSPEKLMEQFSFEYVRMYQNNTVDYSAALDGAMFT